MSASQADVKAYLQNYKIMELLDHLSNMVLFFQPEDPVDFMARVVRDMKRANESGSDVVSLFTEESLRAYFRLLDPLGVGSISWDQVRSALALLGLKDFETPSLKLMPVFEDTFVSVGMKGLQDKLKLD